MGTHAGSEEKIMKTNSFPILVQPQIGQNKTFCFHLFNLVFCLATFQQNCVRMKF